jgi:hypothetical protein
MIASTPDLPPGRGRSWTPTRTCCRVRRPPSSSPSRSGRRPSGCRASSRWCSVLRPHGGGRAAVPRRPLLCRLHRNLRRAWTRGRRIRRGRAAAGGDRRGPGCRRGGDGLRRPVPSGRTPQPGHAGLRQRHGLRNEGRPAAQARPGTHGTRLRRLLRRCCGPLPIPLYLFAAASGSLLLGTVASAGFALATAVPVAILGLMGRRWTSLLRGVVNNNDVISRTAGMALLTLRLLLVPQPAADRCPRRAPRPARRIAELAQRAVETRHLDRAAPNAPGTRMTNRPSASRVVPLSAIASSLPLSSATAPRHDRASRGAAGGGAGTPTRGCAPACASRCGRRRRGRP